MTAAAFSSSFTPAEINAVVGQFYGQIRQHPVLGPIFAAHVDDWPTHEKKIAGFWRGALLRECGYSGNPMQTHVQAGNVREEHFLIWLALFDEVMEESLSPPKARHWSDLAHRIGQSLQFGLSYARNKAAGVPPNLLRNEAR